MNKEFTEAIAHLKRAKVLLLTKGWVKGVYAVNQLFPDGYRVAANEIEVVEAFRPSQGCAFCSVGALAATAGEEWRDRDFSDWAAWAKADNTRGHMVLEALDQSSDFDVNLLLTVNFNDHPETTLTDVCRRFDHAIARLTLQGFGTE